MRTHRNAREDGFTLIELMVVVLIIAVLVSIAVPAMFGAQKGAKSKAAQVNVRSALSAAKTLHAEAEAYWVTSDANTFGLLRAAEPSLGWVATMGAPSGSTDNVSWASNASEIVVAVRAATKDCFFIRDGSTGANAGTWFGKLVDTDASTCDADGAAPEWKRSIAQGWPKSGASLP
jgi:general secretion pathway protein G